MNNGKQLRVLILTWEFPPNIVGGLGMACYGMVRALLEIGVEVTLVLPGERPGFFEMKHAQDADLPYPTVLNGDTEKRYRDDPYHPDDLTPPRYRSLVEQVIPHLDFDVIHAHDWLTFEAGLYAKEVTGKPLLCHVHSTEYDRACCSGNERIHQYERVGLEMADRVIAVSRYTADGIRENYGIDPGRIQVIHNAYSLRKPKSVSGRLFREPVVLFMGRITCQKGPDLFLEIARRVISRFPELRFLIAGDGDMKNSLLHRAAYYGMQNRVLFTGFLNRDEVAGILAISDILVAPSISDPFNITVLAAMSSGLAVVVSRRSGVTEVVRRIIVVDHWDVYGISDQIVSLLKNPAQLKRLGREGMAEVKRIRWHDAARQLKEIYGELVCST